MNIVDKTLFRLVDIVDYEETNVLHNMYDIMVEDDESYVLSNGVVSHNSALGNHVAVRNPKIHGGIALRGKPLNVRGMKPIEILKNKEIFELTSIIGLEFGKPITDLNYGKIIIMSDMDFDGSAIFCLLLNLFSNWPDLFREGRIYRALTPLYICTKGKDTQIFYTKVEFDKFNSKGWDVSFCKGLGTLSKDAYRECINNPYLVKMTGNEFDMEMLEMAFGDSADKRKNWMFE